MCIPTLFADLHIASEHDVCASISFKELQTPKQDPSPSFGIHNFFKLSEEVSLPLSGRGPLFNNEHLEAYVNHRKVTEKILELLNGTKVSNLSSHKLDTMQDDFHHGPWAVGGKTSFVGTRGVETMKSYQELSFHFRAGPEPGLYEFTSHQNLHFTCPPSQLEEAIMDEIEGFECFDTVEIMSGTCLFNGSLLAASLEGGVNAEVLEIAKPTLYEMEYVARIAPTIANIASLVISCRKLINNTSTLPANHLNINLDVPSFQYYPSAVAKFDQGQCTSEQALQWMDAIDRRHNQMGAILEKAIHCEMQKRNATSPRKYKIRIRQRDNLIATSIKESVAAGKSPSLKDVLKQLNEEPDKQWYDFYGLLKRSERPKDFRSLGYLTYVFEVVKKGLLASSSTGTEITSRRLLIGIDDIAEFRIYAKAQKYLKKLRDTTSVNSTLLEVYPCQRMFVNSNQRAHFYVDDPSPVYPELIDDPSVNVEKPPLLTPADVMERLYGNEYAKHLRMLFKEMGLR